MELLRLNLLGSFALWRGEQPCRLPTRKAEAVLAYLALEGPAAVNRERLAGLLWSEADDSAARASLRQTLSLLGKACGPGAIVADSRTVRLAGERFAVDVLALEAAAAADEASPQDAALYRGELLAGLAIGGNAFEEWLQARRTRLHEAALRLLARQAEQLESAGQFDQAVSAALRLLELDPLDEAAHRRLMQLYVRSGRRAAAMQQYQACAGLLERELGTEPEPATRALVNDLLRRPVQAEPRTAPGNGPAAPPPVHDAPLIGRDGELATLSEALHEAKSGRGRMVAMVAEAGIGKTRMTEELSWRATRAGVRVLVARCHENQQLFALVPWVEALRQAQVPQDPELLRALGPAWCHDLATLLPEIGQGGAPPMTEGSAPARQARLYEAVVRALGQLCARAPTLLVLEDLHWSDPPSLQLLAALAHRGADWPLLVVVTARDEQLPSARRLQRVLHDLGQPAVGAMPFSRVTLAALSRMQTDALVRALHRGGGPSAAQDTRLSARVWALSEGNPLVVVEALRALRGRPQSRGADDLGLPDRIRELILGQIEHLGSAGRHVLELVAVAGRETDFALLRGAAGLGLRRAAETVEELVRRRLLCVVGEAFDFSHARIRQAVDDTLLPPVRQELHLALARALERHPHAEDGVRMARLAYHYGQTDRHAQAALHLMRHAQHAAHGGAHVQSLELLAQASRHLQRLPARQTVAQRRELLLRQARSLFFLGRFDEVLLLLDPEQAAFEAARDPRLAAAYFLRRGSTRTYLGDHAGAAADAERALAEASACDDQATMGRAHFLLSLERFWDRPEEGVVHGEQAVALLSQLGESWWTGQACWILGLNLSYRGRFAEGLAMEARASRLADETADRRLASYAAWTAGFIHTLAGELESALRECRRSVELALDPLNRMTSLGILALALIEQGDAPAALEQLAEAVPQAISFRIPQMHGLFLAFRGEAQRTLGDLAAARCSAAAGAEATRSAGYRYGYGWAQRVQARIERDAGLGDAALARLEDAERTFGALGAPYEAARTRLERARWLLQAGRSAEAHRLARPAHDTLEALGLAHAPALASLRPVGSP